MQVIIRFHDNEQQFDMYALDFKNFPLVKNHAHPYFVIVNALPKLQRHAASSMSASVMALYGKMVLIVSCQVGVNGEGISRMKDPPMRTMGGVPEGA